MQPIPAWSQAAWGVLAGFSLALNPAIAQTSVTAATDSTGTTVDYSAATQTYIINGGTQVDANLFHSFQQLGLSAGEIANFGVNPDVANVLARVTGGQASIINGLLQVSGGSNPNLFILNPAGVLLSPNARLNLAGSFSVSTASGLAFEDGVFRAISSNDYGALVGDPSGYVFLGNEGVLLNEADLAVNPGESLTLTGNTVLNTGTLTAPEGNVSIVAIPEEGLVRISQTGLILSLALPTDQLQSQVENGLTALDLPELLAGDWGGAATTVQTLADGTVVLSSGNPINAHPGAIASIGTVDVSGDQGGRVVLLGEDIALPEGLIDISGTSGGELAIYADGELTLGTGVNAAGQGHALFDPNTFTIGTAEAATLVSTLAGGDATVEATETINVNAAIDSSGQRRRNTLTFQDENSDNNLTINLNALITLGRRQTLNGEGTTINVNVTDPGIVQNAVALAATGATVNLGAGTYQEGSEVRLSRDITLTGAGAGNTQLDGNNAHRVLRVNRGVTARLNDLTLTQGRSGRGGGIYSQGTLILNGSAIANNQVTRNGGGIYSNGEVTLINSALTNNRASGNGGGIFANRGSLTLNNSSVTGNQAGRDGGGIRSNNTVLTVDGSTIANNQARFGGGLYTNRGTLILNNSQVANNRANRDGGGIRSNRSLLTLNHTQILGNQANRDGGGLRSNGNTVTLNTVQVSGNRAGRNGGGLWTVGALVVNNGAISGNQAGQDGGGIRTNNSTANLRITTITGNQANRDGGGLYTNRGTTTVDRSTIAGNMARRDGGGIRSHRGTITFSTSTVANNDATRNGGGVYANRTNLTFNGSTVSTNGAQLGGGIYNNRGTVTATNSTLSGNTANRDGGGAYSSRGRFTLANSTVSSNQSDRGGGLYGNRATLTFSNSLVTGNTALGAGNEVFRWRGSAASNHSLFGFSGDAGLSGLTANLANGDLVPTVPLSQILSPLASNGGPTQTHALVVGSPALDASGNNATAFDQRGIAAIGRRDIGAFEGTIPPEVVPSVGFENTLFNSLEPLDEVEGVACQTLDLSPELRERLGLVEPDAAEIEAVETESSEATVALRAGASPQCLSTVEQLQLNDTVFD
ncbi:MAG: filamentous hemagglutinin N-terminal domain-containing protein [Leptolyngbyaceae cyanobacterium]